MKVVSAALFAVFLPTVAAAQNSGVYIQAGPIADILFVPSADGYPMGMNPLSSSGATYTWNDLNGDRRWQPGEEGSLVSSSLSIGFPSVDVRRSKSRVAPGASATVGVFITPSVSLRLEGSFQGEHVTTSEAADAGQSLSIVNRQATAITDIFVSAGWHHGESRRTTVTYLAGMVFRRQREEAALEYTYSTRTPPATFGNVTFGAPVTFDEQFGATSYSAGIMAGLDVAFNFSDHLAVVPQLRMVAANHTLSVRPAIAMRWRP